MIKEAIGTGKTLDEARESAVLKLNAKETKSANTGRVFAFAA